jgi:hypothetical protein
VTGKMVGRQSSGATGRRSTAKAISASTSEPEFNRDEVAVCMVLAFAIGNALLTVIYRMMG